MEIEVVEKDKLEPTPFNELNNGDFFVMAWATMSFDEQTRIWKKTAELVTEGGGKINAILLTSNGDELDTFINQDVYRVEIKKMVIDIDW
jgi:hypothetical protein